MRPDGLPTTMLVSKGFPAPIEIDVYVNVIYSSRMQKAVSSTLQPDGSRFTIRDLAAAFSVTPRTIRFYEDEGLINPERQGQNRLYSKGDRARLAWILRGKRVGFSIADIREMLDLYGADDDRELQRRVTIKRCEERITELVSQKADIDEMIDELQQFVTMLRTGKHGVTNKGL